MTKPTAKALRATLASKKPALTQVQKDAALLKKKLAEVAPFEPISEKSTKKEDAVKMANSLGEANFYLNRGAVASIVQIETLYRDLKATKKALAAAQKELKQLKGIEPKKVAQKLF